MTIKLPRFGLGFFLSVISVVTLAKDAPTSAEQLRSELESALKARDTNAIAGLFNVAGISEEMKSMLPLETGMMVYQGSSNVTLKPLPTGIELTNEVGGVRYRPNIPVVGLIVVEGVKPGNTMQIPYGEQDGKFYLPGTVKEVFDAHAPKSKVLNIMITSASAQETNILNGTYVYLNGGKEVTKTVCLTNSMSYGFRGDGIKSCKFTKDSSDGFMELTIREDEKEVFDSDMVKNTNAISYVKK